jgi:hypothetical protein
MTIQRLLKKEIKARLKKMWCIPPKQNARFVWEDGRFSFGYFKTTQCGLHRQETLPTPIYFQTYKIGVHTS